MNNPTILSSLGDFTCHLPQELNLNVQEALTKELANNIKKHYFSNSEPNIENIDMYIKVSKNLPIINIHHYIIL